MSFQQGLSGLNASSKALDIVGNNIANANTVGFKSAEAHFSDVFANSLAGSGASPVGIGATISAVQQSFSQGNITATNNPLDISINGGGFFQMSVPGQPPTYTRSGQFHLDNSGFIINDQQLQVMGYATGAPGKLVPLQLDSAQIPPLSTDKGKAVIAMLNLDSNEGVPRSVPFDPDVPTSYNYSTAMAVYDTLGVSHTMTLYFARAAAGGAWNVHATMDGAAPQLVSAPYVPAVVGPPAVAASGGLAFDTSGALTTTMPLPMPSWGLNTGAASPWSPGEITFSGTTQYGSASAVNQLNQGGHATGSLTGLSIGSDGGVQGKYSNGEARALGQIVLASFKNVNGLQSLGNNMWAQSSVSGGPLPGAPGTGSIGVLQSSSIEESNVDLTAQLVNMITQQRNYQANAQSIKTQDQIMQTLVNLR